MADADISALSLLIHELAEGLQATGNYLGAARRIVGSDICRNPASIDTIEKVLDELGRSKSAFHELRARLLASEARETSSRIADTTG